MSTEHAKAKAAERLIAQELIANNKYLPRGVQKKMFGIAKSAGLPCPTLPKARAASGDFDAEQMNSRGELSAIALRQYIEGINDALRIGKWYAKDSDRYQAIRVHLHNAAWLKEGDCKNRPEY